MHYDDAWCSIRPDRIDIGPARLWLTVGGTLVRPANSIHSHSLQRSRAQCTVWAGSVAPDGWRRLHIAACRHMQRVVRAGGAR